MNLKVLLTFVTLFTTCLPSIAIPKTKIIRIAIIDSGYNKTTSSKLKLCTTGHKDFTGWGEFRDVIGHGTHIANIIGNNVKVDNYCAIILKFVHDPKYDDKFVGDRIIAAFKYLEHEDVDVINFSGGGSLPNKDEEVVISRLLEKGVRIFVAAGNTNSNLDETCNFFPACYNLKIDVVGNLEGKHKHWKSNYGKYVVTQWEQGTNIKAEVSERIYMTLTGTSQSTAAATAKWVNRSK